MTTRQATKTQTKAYPASRQLATVTDLTSKEAQAVTEAVNPLIADTFALYVKTKNFHWHLAGWHFRDKHRDSATSNALEEILDETERRTWFLFEVLQGANTAD